MVKGVDFQLSFNCTRAVSSASGFSRKGCKNLANLESLLQKKLRGDADITHHC